MTARTCETCEHLQVLEFHRLLGGEHLFDLRECDFEGVSVPCSESGVCGRWAAREDETEDEDG